MKQNIQKIIKSLQKKKEEYLLQKRIQRLKKTRESEVLLGMKVFIYDEREEMLIKKILAYIEEYIQNRNSPISQGFQRDLLKMPGECGFDQNTICSFIEVGDAGDIKEGSRVKIQMLMKGKDIESGRQKDFGISIDGKFQAVDGKMRFIYEI